MHGQHLKRSLTTTACSPLKQFPLIYGPDTKHGETVVAGDYVLTAMQTIGNEIDFCVKAPAGLEMGAASEDRSVLYRLKASGEIKQLAYLNSNSENYGRSGCQALGQDHTASRTYAVLDNNNAVRTNILLLSLDSGYVVDEATAWEPTVDATIKVVGMKRLQGSTTHHVYLYGYVTDANTDLLGYFETYFILQTNPAFSAVNWILTQITNSVSRDRSIQNLIPKENDVFIFLTTARAVATGEYN